MGNYIEIADIDNWPVGWTDAQKNAVITRIELQVEKWAGTFFYIKALDYRLNGNDKNRLFLPLDAHIATITAVEVCELALPINWIDFDSSSIFLNVCGSGTFSPGYSWAEMTYLLGEYESQEIFPRGYNNIHVIGTYGSTELQPVAKEACRILITESNAPGTYKTLYKSEKIGQYAYSYGGTMYGNFFSGIQEADKLIDLLVWNEPTLMTP